MLTVTGLWFDHERTPVGLDHTPVFGWQLEGNCRNIRQTQYRLQVALAPDFAALLYDETCETGNSTAVHAAGLTLQSLQKYYVRVQVWADTAAGPQQTLWSEPAVFITALLDPAAEWKAEFVSAESPETCRKSSAGTMVRAAFTVKPGLRAAYACTTALGLYNVYLNGQKVSTDEMTPGWTSYNRRLLYQTYEVTAMLHPGLNMAGAMLGAGWYKGVMGLTRSRNNYGDTTAFAMQLTLVYADGNPYLANLRKARTTMQYTFARSQTVTWQPQFTYMGFRYALVVQWPGKPEPANFTACVLHSAMQPAGEFTCSEPLVNQLNHNILWGLKSNFLDVPTDCPQRDERLGWTGDAQIFCETACWLADTWTFYSKWLKDLAVDQLPDGGVANVVPNIEETHTEANWLMKNCPYGASGWGDAATVIPWVLYQMYGDDTILRSQYPSMKRWVDFMRANTQNGLFDFKMQLGDWVALDAEPGSYFGATPTALTSQAYYALSAQLLALAAEVLGNRQDAELYAGVHRQAAQDFAANFFTLDGTMTAQTQTAHILALRFGLTPQKWKQKTIQRLLELLEQQNGHLVTGFLGTPYFCAALSQNGCWQQAYDLMLKKDYPGWLYQVLQGATTVWEHWDGRRPDGTMWSAGMNSFNHYAYGAVGAWLYGECAGIGQQPGTAGFCAARLAPRPGGGLRWAQAWHQTPFGRYALQWQVDDGKITVTAAIPPNAAAKICLEPGAKLLETDGLTFAEQNGCPTAQVGSGQYRVSYTMEQ